MNFNDNKISDLTLFSNKFPVIKLKLLLNKNKITNIDSIASSIKNLDKLEDFEIQISNNQIN